MGVEGATRTERRRREGDEEVEEEGKTEEALLPNTM